MQKVCGEEQIGWDLQQDPKLLTQLPGKHTSSVAVFLKAGIIQPLGHSPGM